MASEEKKFIKQTITLRLTDLAYQETFELAHFLVLRRYHNYV